MEKSLSIFGCVLPIRTVSNKKKIIKKAFHEVSSPHLKKLHIKTQCSLLKTFYTQTQ